MANSFIKAEKVVRAALGVLEREVVLPNMVWRDARITSKTAFQDAKNDTVTLALPAYMTARTRTMRSGTSITVDDLDETKVDVTLDTHAYKAVGVTDEELTLDIVDFGAQVLTPAMSAVYRKVEDAVAAEMAGASYEVEIDLASDDPYLGLVDARIALNDASVPAGNRGLAVGSAVEAAILKSDRLSKFDSSGSDSALRENQIGRIAGFTAVSVPALDPDVAIAFHQTAFPLASVVPAIPDGVAWGENQTWQGFGLRALRDYDNALIKDRLLVDVFVGVGTTKDSGVIDNDGKFQPSEDGEDSPILVRAVKLNLTGS